MLTVILAAVLMAYGFQNSFEHKVLFEKAKFTMETKGDLEEAIKIFSQIITKFPDEREYAAKSQYYIGLCYEKLGLTQSKRAQESFQRVVDHYPEQKETVTLAREKLITLKKTSDLVQKGDKNFNIRKVCQGSDLSVSGEVSPDGRYISYTDWRTGDLGVYEIATGKKKHLTRPTEEEPFGFVLRSPWSPDSKQIAYNWYNKENFWDIRIIGIDGTESRVLYRDKDDFPQPADWSPDGKYILAIFDNYYKDKVDQVGLISVKDGTVNILETLKGCAVYYLYFSPYGRYIGYDYPQKKGSQDRDIFIYSIEEKREIPLIQHSANDRFAGWTPDGKHILFSSNRLGTLDAWVISVEEGNPQGDPILVKKEIGSIEPMEFAPDGSFYYGIGFKIRDVYTGILDKERGKFLSSPEKLTGPFVGNNFSPEWSPDGKYLAYISKRHPDLSYGSNSLYIRDLETGEEREVVRPSKIRLLGGVSRGICWSPDGRSILSSGFEEKGQGIYVVDVKTGEMTTLLYGEAKIFNPSWSADGKTIFFIERNFKKEISRVFHYDMETKEKKEIYSQSPNLLWLIPSPDGKLLAFMTHKKHEGEGIGVLMVLPVEGGEPREVAKITGAGEESWTMAWTPDGREILYGKYLYDASGTSGQEKGSELWKVSAEGGESQKLWKMAGPIEELRIHPDGQRVAFSSQELNYEIWVMENFLPEMDKKK